VRGLVIMLALLLGAAGCTKANQDNGIASAGGAGVSVTPTQGTGGTYDAVKWAQCLREHGLTVDDPDPAAPGGGKPHIHDDVSTKEQIDAAADACRAYNPNWGKPAPPPDPAETEKLRKFAQCMREHGIDWDDPDTNPTGAAPPPGGDPEAGKPTPSGPQFEQAIKECGELVPGVIAPEDGTKKDKK
jgi:hypothetical protein